MGFFNTTSAFLAALMSGESKVVTREELNQIQTEIQSAYDRNQADYDRNQVDAQRNTEMQAKLAADKATLEAGFTRLSSEKAQHVQECGVVMSQRLKDHSHAWDIGQQECEIGQRELAVQSATQQLEAAQSKAMVNALQKDDHAWEVGQREYDMQIATELLKKAQTNAMIDALAQQHHAWDIGQREYDLLFPHIPAVAKKQWNKPLVFVASTAIAATLCYTIKRAYDAQWSASKTLSLIKQDFAKIFGKK